MSIRLRTALVVTSIIGVIYASLGLVYSPTLTDLSIGLIISSTALIALGLIDWLER